MPSTGLEVPHHPCLRPSLGLAASPRGGVGVDAIRAAAHGAAARWSMAGAMTRSGPDGAPAWVFRAAAWPGLTGPREALAHEITANLFLES